MDNDSIKRQFLRLAVIEQKKYEEITKTLGVERKQLSKWWDELKNEREAITEIRRLWVRKKFTKIQLSDFYDKKNDSDTHELKSHLQGRYNL